MGQKKEILVLVDEHDNELGTQTREKCHLGEGLRHRAYVVFLFHEGKLLLQQRSGEKLLWPSYWDVSFTSHVYPGESYMHAARRKGAQELGAHFEELEDVYSFVYKVPFGRYSENEFCRLLVGRFDGVISPNPREIMDTKYVRLPELRRELRERPERYTPWLKLAFDGFLKTEKWKNYRE
ncbi:MAG TPA: NUDIX domain-containing protein [Nitrososphaerales archaeon]|nr:NUDIX domain-containing protein [Nitrososphaerales archaeon]